MQSRAFSTQSRACNTTRAIRNGLLTLAAVALMAPAASAQLVLYDDFAGPQIDAAKWAGRHYVTRDGGTGTALETRREITPGQVLLLQSRAVGGDSSNSGTFTIQNALALRRPNTITEIAFTTWIRSLEVSGCAGGADSSAGVRGVFPLFSDGTGDVIAVAEVRRSSSSIAADDEADVVASLVHRAAGVDTVLASVYLGSAELDERVRLRVRWEEKLSRVKFQRGADPVVIVGYAQPFVATPSAPAKYLATLANVADCTTGPAPTAAVVALFNNVRVNQ